jgi:hypothetical protein
VTIDQATGAGWFAGDRLGPALLWAEKAGVDDLQVVAETAGRAGVMARQATAFQRPPTVWRVVGPGRREPARPDPLPPIEPLAPEVAAFAALLVEAGAEPVAIAGGGLAGEVLGLEVARVVVDGDGPRLEVGVGKHDREAQRLLRGDVAVEAVLRQAVDTVRRHRRPGAPPHPLNRLARAGWLRAIVVADPGLVGAAHLAPVPSPVAVDDLRQPAPAAAAGVDTEGRPLLVVCSVGVDVDLVPAAADARLADARRPRLVLAVPEGDDVPPIRRLAARLVAPAEIWPIASPLPVV